MKFLRFFLFTAAFVALFSCNQARVDQPKPVALKLAHYNVGVFNKTESSSTDVIAAMMSEIGADVVSVNEVDSCTTRTGLVDQLADLSKKMGDWGCWYASAMPYKGGAYGIGISYNPKLKVVRTDKVALPKLTGTEPRALAVVEFEDFVFATCHLDYKTADAQLGQIEVINAYMDKAFGNGAKPVFLCGDFNCVPESDPIEEMLKSWKMISPVQMTYPAITPKKCIDYVFVREGVCKVDVVDAKVYTAFKTGNVETASDHLPLYVDVKINK